MPTLQVIDSIKIDIYSREHLPPHLHALYAEYEALIEIVTGVVYAGYLPRPKLKIVLEWLKRKEVRLFSWQILNV